MFTRRQINTLLFIKPSVSSHQSDVTFHVDVSIFTKKNAWIKVRYITLICTNTRQTHQTNVRKSPSRAACKQPYVKNAPFRQASAAETGFRSMQLLMLSKEGNKVYEVNLAFSSYLTGNIHRFHYKEQLVNYVTEISLYIVCSTRGT
jgi:hypothetical protein